MKPISIQLAWAIATNRHENPGFLGRYWDFGDGEDRCKQHILRTRLFETRAKARQALKREKTKTYIPFPKAKVVRVKVTAQQEKP